MSKGAIAKGLVRVLAVSLASAVLTLTLAAADSPRGNVVGFVYESDGTTPIQGAIVKLRNLETGRVTGSDETDRTGSFRVRDLESGFYVYGVVTQKGDFNADTLVGIKLHEAETAKMSISVNPYSSKTAAAQWAEIYREQQAAGEALSGRVLSFDSNSKMAEVSILKGSLAVNDKIHARGDRTNFYQKVTVLNDGTARANRVYAGQTAHTEFKNSALAGDAVFLVCKKSALPLFLGPLGVATIVAGSAAIVKHNDINDHEQEVSAFKH